MAFDDYFLPAASGAASGAAIGTAVSPGIGTAVGAGAGLLMGLFQGGANSKKKAAMEQARREEQKRARESYQRRQQDLQTAMGYFGPVNAKLAELYGPGAVVQPEQQWKPREWEEDAPVGQWRKTR